MAKSSPPQEQTLLFTLFCFSFPMADSVSHIPSFLFVYFSFSYKTSIMFGIALRLAFLTAGNDPMTQFWPVKWTCNVDFSRELISSSKREDLGGPAFLFSFFSWTLDMMSKATAVLPLTQDNKQEDISQQAMVATEGKGRFIWLCLFNKCILV